LGAVEKFADREGITIKKDKSIKGIIQSLDKERQALKISKKEFNKLFTPKGKRLISKIAQAIENHRYPEVESRDLGIVDYDREISGAVKAGDYDDCDTTALRVPKVKHESGKWHVTAHLYWYNQPKTKQEFFAEICTKKKLEFGGFYDLLALGEIHPEVQESFPVIEVRDLVADRQGVIKMATLNTSRSGRILSFVADAGTIEPQYRLLAVSKEPVD